MLGLTCNYSVKNEYSVQWIRRSLTNECPNHDIVHHAICSWIEFSLTVIWIAMTSTDSTDDPNQEGHAEKGHSQSHQKYEHNARMYCILNAELNVILLHWNEQNLESSIIKWGCRPLDENFHPVLMFTSFGSMQIWIGMNVKPSGLHFGIRLINQHSPSKQTSARGGKVYPYNGFLNFFSTCSSAFWRLTSSSWLIS